MSEISKTTSEGTEIRKDGSKVATEGSPSGKTETDSVNAAEDKLPNDGVSPEYEDAEHENGVASPGTRTGA